jgi:hypothetical protein
MKIMAATLLQIKKEKLKPRLKQDPDLTNNEGSVKAMHKLLQSATLTSFVHNGGTKCTIVSDKKIITYDFSFEEKDGKGELIEK